VHPRPQDDAHDSHEHETTEKRVERGEQFRSRRIQAIDRAHSAEDHRRVQKRVYPCQPRNDVVTQRARARNDEDDAAGQRHVPDGAPEKRRPRQQPMHTRLVHRVR
jgi:hypothetical protein